ncbi:unnamed protein product [Lepeophtheirus salmonis]|uniref:(salmon louse) hypothetical protein n=1 Tax=Lepeophtheirus salmonis TaxID=72036 RepID=A0A7R8H568_LEPSM|nr:unnamed protein product [Lepeophtheirus salmonis]CAF2873000.1 unnamed protein product [Lepeophtheirus salmonis]
MKYFHATDNPFQTSNHKFAKVQALFDILNTNFSKFGEVFDPTNVSIDGAMNPYFERHLSKQFLRGKPIRLRYKAWVAAHPKGYAFNISLYQGKHGTNDKSYNEYGLEGELFGKN